MTSTLLLYYDDFHTPLALLAEAIPGAVVIDVDLGGPARERPPAPDILRVDAVDELCEGYLLRAIKAHATYAGGYVLSSALSRPLQAEVCVRVARERGATTVVHGLAGNDQLRFEMALAALSPELDVRTVSGMLGSQNTRNADGVTVSENIWGRSAEAGPLRDLGRAPPDSVYAWCMRPQLRAPSAREELEIEFDKGRPVAVDGAPMKPAALIAELNLRAGTLGVGIVDTVEDGFVGLKSRAVYEAPAATVLIAAHCDLERTVCSRRENEFKALADRAWTNLVYDGFWFDPARVSLEAYIDTLNARVTGVVEVELGSGVRVLARRAAAALYDERDAMYRAGQDYGVAAMSSVAQMLVPPMRAAIARERKTATQGGDGPWNA